MIVAVYGSPRKGGNTDILMDEFLKSVEMKYEVRRFYLRNLKLNPCTECGSCDKTGVCVYKDEIWNIYESIEKADGLVMSSPIFFASISAQLKAFVDRAQPFWARKYLLKQKSKELQQKGFFISVGAIRTQRHFENAKLIIETHMNMLDMKYEGELFYRGVDKKGEINDIDGALKTASEAGSHFAASMP
jgi:multimeric flavodoxin WrbA